MTNDQAPVTSNTDHMHRQEQLMAQADKVLLKNYRQQPLVMASGRGVELFDVAGKRYLDMTAGIAVCCLGHAHPALAATLAEQARTLLHTSNLYFIERQIAAATAITDLCFADRVFFCNSGAEANEAALKLARRYQHVVVGESDRDRIIATSGSFHGRSMATVSITGQDKYRQGFGPLIDPVTFVPFGDVDAAAAALSSRDACAMIVEPIQAEGGIIMPPHGYLAKLRSLCDETGTLLIFDEVQTGVGRTGKWFGHQWHGVEPDAMSLAKALGGGVPIGALAVSDKVAQGLTFQEGGAVPHASTFGGNPLACAAAVTVLETIDRENLLDNALRVGNHLASRLGELTRKYDAALEVRGQGLLVGLALSGPAAPTVVRCREHGVLLSVAGGNVVRFAPALIVGREHIDEAIGVLDNALSESS